MKFIFFGSPEFAAIILERLIAAGLPPALIVCNPDRPTGRKKIITPPPAKIVAQKNGFPVLQPVDLKTEDFKSEIKDFDLGIVAAYGQIIPKEIIGSFKNGVLGVHPSLLPKYRGATPIQSVILNGDRVTGVTLFLMDEQIDHGPILAQREFRIQNLESGIWNYETLHDKLAELGGDLLVETIPKYAKGEYKLQPQNDKDATYTKKFKDDDAYIDLEKDDPVMVERRVRALNPEPGVWTFQNNKKRLKILEAEIIDGKLKLKKIQIEGKTPQNL